MIWDGIRDGSVPASLSLSCSASLQTVVSGLDSRSTESLKMVAASGNTPELLLRRTMTSLGDYDGCLNIGGQYCLSDIFPIRVDPSFKKLHQELLFLDEITAFKNFSFIHGLCLPVTCSNEDVRAILNSSLRKHFFKPNGFIDCDTSDTISWKTRILNMSTHQAISLILVSILLSTVVIGTLLHLIQFSKKINTISSTQDVIDRLDETDGSFFVETFSLIKNLYRLIFTRIKKTEGEGTDHFIGLEAYKLGLVLFGCAGHVFTCLEIPNSYYMLSEHQEVQDIFSKTENQMYFNDQGLVMFAHLGGFATFWTLYPIMTKLFNERKRFPYMLAVLDRYLRFIPSIMTIIAVEFIWTMSFSGPFFTRVSNFVHQKCTKSWWWNLTFLQNWGPVLDICAGHTFFSALDMQLFVIGLVVISILVRNQRSGLTLMGLLSIIAFSRVAYVASVKETYATIYRPWPDTSKILDYMDFIHTTTPTYIPIYMFGVAHGLILYHGYRVPTNLFGGGIYFHIVYLALGSVFPAVTGLLNGLYNEYGIITDAMGPALIIANRIIQSTSCCCLLTYYMTVFHPVKKADENESKRTTETPCEPSTSDAIPSATKKNPETDRVFAPVVALCRLSYSLYMSNYLIVKTSFFTSRTLLRLGFHGTISRILSSLMAMIALAFLFHLFVVAPFDNLRRRMFSAKQKKT